MKIIPAVDKKMVASVVVGLAAFGALAFVINMLPSNPVTNLFKRTKEIATAS